MSVTRWISQDSPYSDVEFWEKKPVVNCEHHYFLGAKDEPEETTICLPKFRKLFPAAWAALDATRDANGMAGPIEVIVSIEPKGEGK